MSDPKSRIGSMMRKSWPLLAISLLLAVAFGGHAQAQAQEQAQAAELTCDYIPSTCGTDAQRANADAVAAVFIADESPGGGQMSICGGFLIAPGL